MSLLRSLLMPQGSSSSVDGAVLAELRGIREEIRELSAKVGQSASRDDLDDYVRKDVFEGHVASHARALDGWKAWAVIVVAGASMLWNLLGGPHLILVMSK